MPLENKRPQDLYILTVKSGNRKVGKGSPVSMSHMGTCPPSCKLKAGCYATCGRLGLVWWRLGEGQLVNGVSFAEFCKQVKALDCDIWRHNQAGDLPGARNRLHKGRCLQLARANKAEGRNRGGYTYTHYPVLPSKKVSRATAKHNAQVIRAMNAEGFTVNLSADTLAEADAMVKLKAGPVAVVLPKDQTQNTRTPEGRRVVVCPAITKENVNCIQCRLCQKRNRGTIVGFPAHGSSAKRADQVARGE